jgi:hypothetical protein
MDLEGNDLDIIEELSRKLPGGNEEIHEDISQDRRCP